jgi:hypothetical protein
MSNGVGKRSSLKIREFTIQYQMILLIHPGLQRREMS